ncbi:MAG: FAD-dependent oxidoreductase [Ignavibacteriaceae bacterium]|nr:FAD-dependent oxidoreductase [Ignavibacteriaceae bacterium]
MKKVVIIGAGFGGLTVAKELAKLDFKITIIDKTNHHLFQPLLYQVATAALSPADIAIPIRSGRAFVNDDLSINGINHIFIIGDPAAVKNEKGEFLPAIAPAAIQQGKYVAKFISANLIGKPHKKFKYKGTMATIGKAKAVAVIKGLQLSGLIAWLAWSFIHVLFLISFRNKLRVMSEWIWHYITNRPGIRLIIKFSEEQLTK